MSESERLSELENAYWQLKGEVGVINAKLEPLERGVSNFRDFQVRGNRYFDRAEAVLDANENRRRRNIALAKIIAPFVLAAASFLGYQFWNLSSDVVQMVHQWRVAKHFDGSFFALPQMNQNNPQDAGVPRNP